MLVDLFVPAAQRDVALREAAALPSIQISVADACSLELLATGALSPLDRLTAELSVRSDQSWAPGTRLTLRDAFNERLAILTVDGAHAAGGAFLLTGEVSAISRPRWRGFSDLRLTPAELRPLFSASPVAWWIDDLPDAEGAREARDSGQPVLLQLASATGKHDLPVRVQAVRTVIAKALPDRQAVIQIVPFTPAHDVWRERIASNCGATRCIHRPAGALHPEAAAVLTAHAESRPGFCVWFTGLPSSGKSTVASAVAAGIEERGRRLTFLDGDVVRTHLSKGLGFSREDRDTNILRIGWVASEIVRHGGGVICAAVSPYEGTREQVRAMVGSDRFVLVYVDTPAGVCESRDVKGLYAQARAGAIRGFTGVDDPYEPPRNPSLVLSTTSTTAESNTRRVMEYLIERGFL